MSPARRAVAGLPVALLHAAGRSASRRLPGRQSARHGEPRTVRRGRRGPVPLHPGHHGQGDRRGPRHPDRPLRRFAAAVDDPHVDRDRQDAADHVPGAAVRLRHLRHQLPRRPARLLDHDEPLDDRAAGDRAEAPRPDATTGPDGEAPPMSIMDRMLHGGAAAPPAARRRSRPRTASRHRAVATASGGASSRRRRAAPAAPPPPSPRKKKKRSGRRR